MTPAMMDKPYLVPVVVIGVFFIGVIGLMIHSVRGPSKEKLFRQHGERMQPPPARSGIDHAAGGFPADVGFSGDGGWGDGGGGGGGGGGDGGGH
jgi:hypothetical protein